MRRLTVPGTKVRPGTVVGLTLEFEAAGPVPIQVDQLGVTADGLIEEPLFLGGLRAVHDSDRDGRPGLNEPVLANLAAPAFPHNDTRVTVTLNPPLRVTPGQTERLLLVVDLLFPTPTRQLPIDTMPGLTVVHALRAASDVVASANGAPVAARGRFPVEGVLLYQLNDHILITEVSINPPYFVELFNPTPDVVDLSDYYLTDYTDAGAGYHQLPSGANFAPDRSSDDLLVRFPPGASIDPGETIVVAWHGREYQNVFQHNVPNEPNYSIYDEVMQWFWDTMHFPVGSPHTWLALYHGFAGSGPTARPRDVPVGRFRRDGEQIVLFTWDGQSDTVQDVDMVCWGTPSGARDARPDKTGLSADGPDADTVPSPYLPDTPAANQAAGARPSSGWTNRAALRRVDLFETGEAAGTGNGQAGHDETSEPWDRSFRLDYADPGRQ